MKFHIKHLLVLSALFFFVGEMCAQYGYGNSGYGNGYGRQRSSIPQAQSAPIKEEPKTAAEIIDGSMPKISATLELDEFETAIVSSILKKYLQQRIEMQILELPQEQMLEGLEKINKNQTEELKSGLPTEKYDAFVALQKKGLAKVNKEKKRKKRRKFKE